MRKNTKKKLAPVAVAAIAAAVTLPIVAAVWKLLGLFRLMDLKKSGWIVLAFLAVYGLAAAAVFVGVMAAARQRLREIDRGEEEEAKKY